MVYESVDASQKASIAMLQNGDLDQALCSFRQALDEIRQYVSESASYEETQGVEQTQDIDNRHNGADASTLILSVALGDCTLRESQTAKSCNLLSFYYHAFVVGTTPPNTYASTSQAEQGIDYYNRLTTALLFNMALTFHCKGVLAEPKSLESLRKAILFYRLCINSMSVLSGPDGAGMDDLYVIQLVSWNNMGHVHRHLVEKDNVIRCRALLYQALFEDTALSSGLMYGYPYASFYLFVVGSEVHRRRGISRARLLCSPPAEV
jgi:hypothetical protein